MVNKVTLFPHLIFIFIHNSHCIDFHSGIENQTCDLNSRSSRRWKRGEVILEDVIQSFVVVQIGQVDIHFDDVLKRRTTGAKSMSRRKYTKNCMIENDQKRACHAEKMLFATTATILIGTK